MLDWIIENWDVIFGIIGAIVTCCSTIVALTPTTKDDTIWAKIVKILDVFSVVNTAENKEKLEKIAAKKKSK